MKSKAITLVELLVVLAILSIVAAIIMPVLAKARVSSLESVSKSNLRQIYLQTQLYIADYDSIPYGTSFEMGLPPMPQPNHLDTLNKLKPPLAPHPISKTIGRSYYCNYSDPTYDALPIRWREYALKHEAAAILYIDPFFNDPDKTLMWGEFYKRKMLGVNLGGSIVTRHVYGDWAARTWH